MKKYIIICLVLTSCHIKHCETREEYNKRLSISAHYKDHEIDSLQQLINQSVEKRKCLAGIDWIDESLNELRFRNKQQKLLLLELDSINHTNPLPCQ